MLENGDADGLSLRAVASTLGGKAPSLCRYFPHKEALEIAVSEEVLNSMRSDIWAALEIGDPDMAFRKMVDSYLRFARERFPPLLVCHAEPPAGDVLVKSWQGRLEPFTGNVQRRVRTNG